MRFLSAALCVLIQGAALGAASYCRNDPCYRAVADCGYGVCTHREDCSHALRTTVTRPAGTETVTVPKHTVTSTRHVTVSHGPGGTSTTTISTATVGVTRTEGTYVAMTTSTIVDTTTQTTYTAVEVDSHTSTTGTNTITDYETLATVTVTAMSTTSITQQKRGETEVPSYAARACKSHMAYDSACACWGVAATTVTDEARCTTVTETCAEETRTVYTTVTATASGEEIVSVTGTTTRTVGEIVTATSVAYTLVTSTDEVSAAKTSTVVTDAAAATTITLDTTATVTSQGATYTEFNNDAQGRGYCGCKYHVQSGNRYDVEANPSLSEATFDSCLEYCDGLTGCFGFEYSYSNQTCRTYSESLTNATLIPDLAFDVGSRVSQTCSGLEGGYCVYNN